MTGIISEVLNSDEFSTAIDKIRNAFLSPYVLWMISTIGMVIFLQLVSILLMIIILRKQI